MSAGPDVEHLPEPQNTEQREQMLAKARDAVRQEKRDAVESSETKRWLEGQLDEQKRTVPVMGRDFAFRPIGTDAIADVLESVGDGEDLALAEMPNLLRRVCQLLADSCTDPDMDRAAWGKISPDVVEGVFEDVAFPEEGLSPEQRERVEKFRDE